MQLFIFWLLFSDLCNHTTSVLFRSCREYFIAVLVRQLFVHLGDLISVCTVPSGFLSTSPFVFLTSSKRMCRYTATLLSIVSSGLHSMGPRNSFAF